MPSNPWIRRRFFLRALVSAAICLLAGALLILAAASLAGWTLFLISALLLVVMVFASRQVASWWKYARFCPRCGGILDRAWCLQCEQYSAAELLIGPAGTLDTRLYGNQDGVRKLISMILAVALRDRATAVRLLGTANEIRIWVHDREGWVERPPLPQHLIRPIISALLTIANVPCDWSADSEGDFWIVDQDGQQRRCHVKSSQETDGFQLQLEMEYLPEHHPAMAAQP